jgi:phosphoglycolate phosphatase
MQPGNDPGVIRAVLFGLDGTLLDTAPDLVATLNAMRGAKGLSAMQVEDLRHFITHGVAGLIKAGMPPCDDETLALWKDDFLARSRESRYNLVQPFTGVEPMLAELKKSDVTWGIVTNKTTPLFQPLLEQNGFLSSAAVVICGDTVSQGKPHPEAVLAACETLNHDPEQVLMVGDDMRDIEAGRRAGCQTAFALYGYGAREMLSHLTEDTVLIHSPEDVLGLLPVAASA